MAAYVPTQEKKRSSKGISDIPATDGQVLNLPPKTQILTVVQQHFENSTVKYSIEKLMLLNFVDLPTIFYPRLFKETYCYL